MNEALVSTVDTVATAVVKTVEIVGSIVAAPFQLVSWLFSKNEEPSQCFVPNLQQKITPFSISYLEHEIVGF